MAESIITDPHELRILAEQKHEQFEIMRYMLQFDDELSDEALDHHINLIAASIIAAIDCKTCARCCHSLDVYLIPQDVEQIALAADVPQDEILTSYVDQSDSVKKTGEWGRFRTKPCVFLHGTLCSIYAHRPDTCRRYPQFTPDFRWVLEDLIEGAALCPIIYNVLIRVEDDVSKGHI